MILRSKRQTQPKILNLHVEWIGEIRGTAWDTKIQSSTTTTMAILALAHIKPTES